MGEGLRVNEYFTSLRSVNMHILTVRWLVDKSNNEIEQIAPYKRNQELA